MPDPDHAAELDRLCENAGSGIDNDWAAMADYCFSYGKEIAAELRELRAERDALIQDRDDWKLAAEAEAAAHDEARDELREIHERDL